MQPTICVACGWMIEEDVESCPACKSPLERQPRDDQPEDAGPQAVEDAGPHGLEETAPQGAEEATPAAEHAGSPPDFSFHIRETPVDHSAQERGLLFLLLSPSGRAGRLAFLLGFSFVLAFYVTAILAGFSTLPVGSDEDAGNSVGVVVTILTYVVMLPLAIKRLHDFDVSGWGLSAVVLCGAFVVPLITLIEGTRGRNRYGRPVRLRWSRLSTAFALAFLSVGAYSAVMFVSLIVVEEKYTTALAEHDRGASDSTQRQMKTIYEHASWGRKWCPFCTYFAAYEMYSAWAYGGTLYERQQWEGAAEWLEKSVRASERIRRRTEDPQMEKDLIDLRMAFADALEAAGESDRAADVRAELADELSDRALTNRVDRSTALSVQGRMHLDQKEHNKAQTVFTQLIEIQQQQLAAHPSDQQVRSTLGGNYHDRALARFNLGDLDGAQVDLREAIDLQTAALQAAPEVSQAAEFLGLHHELLGQLHAQRGDADAALAAFEKACEANPTSLSHHWRAAWTLYERLEFEKIVELLSDFLENAQERHLEYLLAVSLLYEERNVQAERVIARLRSRHRNSVEAHFLHGVANMMKRDYADAAESLEKAYRQKPGDPAILFNLSVSLAQTNRKPEALRVMAELGAIDTALAERIRRYLQSGEGQDNMQPMFELSIGA